MVVCRPFFYYFTFILSYIVEFFDSKKIQTKTNDTKMALSRRVVNRGCSNMAYDKLGILVPDPFTHAREFKQFCDETNGIHIRFRDKSGNSKIFKSHGAALCGAEMDFLREILTQAERHNISVVETLIWLDFLYEIVDSAGFILTIKPGETSRFNIYRVKMHAPDLNANGLRVVISDTHISTEFTKHAGSRMFAYLCNTYPSLYDTDECRKRIEVAKSKLVAVFSTPDVPRQCTSPSPALQSPRSPRIAC